MLLGEMCRKHNVVDQICEKVRYVVVSMIDSITFGNDLFAVVFGCVDKY